MGNLQKLERGTELCKIYACLLLAVPGIGGSLLSLKVFSSRQIKKSSTNIYLIVLSTVDAGYLLVIILDEVLPSIVRGYNIEAPMNIIDQHTFLCKTVSFFRHNLRAVANWIIVAFTIERLILVHFPIQQGLVSTERCARRNIAAIMLFCSAMSGYSLISNEIVLQSESFDTKCDVAETHIRFYFSMTVIYAIFTILVPIFLICASNMLIIRQLRTSWRRLKSLQERSKEESAKNDALKGVIEDQLENSKIMWMLILISTSSIVLNVPYFTCWTMAYFINVNNSNQLSKTAVYMNAVKAFSLILHTFNYSCHFLLLFISRKNFRRVLIKKLSCRLDSSKRQLSPTQAPIQYLHAGNL
ncbi:hypothetical protein ACOME3_010140 [Neoechinorhynchus agilis]